MQKWCIKGTIIIINEKIFCYIMPCFEELYLNKLSLALKHVGYTFDTLYFTVKSHLHHTPLFLFGSSTNTHVLFFSTTSTSTLIAFFHSSWPNVLDKFFGMVIQFKEVRKVLWVCDSCHRTQNGTKGIREIECIFLMSFQIAMGRLLLLELEAIFGWDSELLITLIPRVGFNSWICMGWSMDLVLLA